MRLTLAALALSASLLGSAPSGPLWDLLSSIWGTAPSARNLSMPRKEGSRADPNGSRKAGSQWDPNGLTLPAPPPPTDDEGSRWDPDGRS